jgi:thioredoxin-dependent peroxiredoxin
VTEETHAVRDLAQTAPDIDLPDGRGELVSLSGYRGEQQLVVFFTRSFLWQTCQRHARQLGRAYSDLRALGAEVIAIGTGQPRQASEYQRRLDLPYPVLADPDGSSHKRFQVGRWALGFLRQSAIFVIDRQGRIVYARVVNNPGTALDLDAVRAALRLEVTDVSGGNTWPEHHGIHAAQQRSKGDRVRESISYLVLRRWQPARQWHAPFHLGPFGGLGS